MHFQYSSSFTKIYKAYYNRFINAYLDKYLGHHKVDLTFTFTPDTMPEGITGIKTITMDLMDVPPESLSSGSNLIRISHELCHWIALQHGINTEITKVLHDHHGIAATKPIQDISTDFPFRAKTRTWSIPRTITKKVIDYNILRNESLDT